VTANGLARELERLVAHGLSSAQAIVAATHAGARALGIASAVGTIEPGLRADVIVIDGDPLDDIGLLGRPERIELVLRNGRSVAGARSAEWAGVRD
jgi:imidazolonepropionase-like amidohydrolase